MERRMSVKNVNSSTEFGVSLASDDGKRFVAVEQPFEAVLLLR